MKWIKVISGAYELRVDGKHWLICRSRGKRWHLCDLNKRQTFNTPIRIDDSFRNLVEWVADNPEGQDNPTYMRFEGWLFTAQDAKTLRTMKRRLNRLNPYKKNCRQPSMPEFERMGKQISDYKDANRIPTYRKPKMGDDK